MPSQVGFSLSMLGWALNEEENIATYIKKAEQFLTSVTNDFELIIIDDGSTDRTVEIATEHQQTRPWLRIYSNGQNRGSGYNTRYAISLATKDYLFWETVDWAYDITLLGENMHLADKYTVLQGVRIDAATGQRILRNRSDNRYKALISFVNYALVRVLFQLPLNDYQNVTLYPRKLIQGVQIESESAFTNPECLLKTWWQGATFKEIPVPFIKRGNGVAKGTRPKVIIASILDILRWWMRWVVLGKRQHFGQGRVIRWNPAEHHPMPAAENAIPEKSL